MASGGSYRKVPHSRRQPEPRGGKSGKKRPIDLSLAGKRASMNITRQTFAFIKRLNKTGNPRSLKIEIGEGTARLDYLIKHQDPHGKNPPEWKRAFREIFAGVLQKTTDYWAGLIGVARVRQMEPAVKGKLRPNWDVIIEELERLRNKELDTFEALSGDYLKG